jgi:hypothetical protein
MPMTWQNLDRARENHAAGEPFGKFICKFFHSYLCEKAAATLQLIVSMIEIDLIRRNLDGIARASTLVSH